MHVELFTVAGRYVEVEQELRKVIEEIKGKVDKPDKVRLAMVKVREESLNEIAKYLEAPIERIPPQYRSLVAMLKRYEINELPALVLNGVKVHEGEPVNLEELTSRILAEAEREFGVKLREEGPELRGVETIPPVVSAKVQPLGVAGVPKFVVGRPSECTSCVYYGEETRTCFLLLTRVPDARNPPCKV